VVIGMNDRERQLWTEYVRQREARKDEKPVRKQHPKKPAPAPEELDAALDELTREGRRKPE
jgi:hypothetical protein